MDAKDSQAGRRMMTSLSIQQDCFYRDNRPVRLLSGAMHYFRIVPEYWKDRLLKMKAMGLNTLETYMPWNLHEPKPGRFDFSGQLDIVRYLELAAELDMMVIVRPGPYICSEWDMGGLPSWLLRDPGMRLRCAYPPYLKAVDRYFDAMLPQLVPLQASCGGPVVAMQVENEYGSYGNDKTYLRHLEAGMRRRGVDCLLFTSDGPTDWMLQGGTLPELIKVANFGTRSDQAFAKLREHQPVGPLMCGEFWNGWFDHWGKPHHRREPADAALELDHILAAGASVNFYMFHGGTNFGFMAGANHAGVAYEADVTSYDYGAPLDESGVPNEKFFAFREVIGKHETLPALSLPPPIPRKAFGTVKLSQGAALFAHLEVLSKSVRRPAPVPMEQLGQDYGFILYRTFIQGPRESCVLALQEVHDRALIFIDGEYRGVVDRNMSGGPINLEFGSGRFQLDILVENMGRINYGQFLHDYKGITHGVRLDNQFLFDWIIYPLPLRSLKRLRFGASDGVTGPAFYKGTFNIEEPADTFLALPGWTKGVVWLNGFNLGRFWEEKGPQRTLYVPAPKLRCGRNEIVVLELHDAGERTVEFRDSPQLG